MSLLDELLSERFSNAASLRLMEHAATLDLRDLEDSETAGPAGPRPAPGERADGADGPVFGQAQDMMTLAGFAAGHRRLCARG